MQVDANTDNCYPEVIFTLQIVGSGLLNRSSDLGKLVSIGNDWMIYRVHTACWECRIDWEFVGSTD